MAIQVINTGTSANSGNGDSIRTAFTKVNQNFDYLEGIVMGTSTNFNSGVRSVVKPMLVHDSHNGLVAAYNSINDRIVLTVGSNNFTSTNITAGNLTVANTSTFKDVQITGLLNIGIIQGFDDVNIIKFADDGSLNFRMRNTFGLGNTQINLLDQVNGSFNIIHQNSPANSGFFAAGQNYIYDDQGRAINIGRNSDINFYSRSGWNAYTTPEVAITNTAVNITSTLTLTKNFFNIGGKQLSVSGSSILLDNSAISVITDKLSAGIYTATLTTAGNIILPGDTSIAYNRRLPTGSTVTSFGATFSSDGPFNGVGSVYFDGSDRLEVYNDGQFDSVVDAYTIEWFQKPLTAGTLTDATILILGTEENQTVQARNFYATSVYSTGTYTAFTLEGSLEVVLPFTGTYINTWTHIAYVKSTSSFRAYINGNQVFSTNTNVFPTPVVTTNNLVIGTRPTLATYENYYTGLLSNLRWEAREVYSSNFTPPSSKLTATTFTRFLLQSENSLNYLDDASGFGNERPQNIQFNISTSSLVLNENGVLILNQHRDYEYGELAGNTFRIDTNHPYYTQMSIHNRNTATTATSDIVLVRDDGDLEAGTAILDIGINSSNYAEPGPFGIHSPGSAYIFTNDADLVIGTQSAGKILKFHAGGSDSTDSGGELNPFYWQFNRSVRTIVATPGPLNFLVQNTQNNSAAAALYQARNNVDNFVTFGIWSGNAGVEDGNQGPNESFLYASSTATLNIGKQHDIDFYTDEVNGYAGTPTLTLSRIDRTSTFNGNVIPREDLTYDLGSPTKQWNNLYVGSSTIYLGNVPMSLSGTTLLINGVPIGEGSTGQIGFSGQKIISKNNGKVWIDPSNSVGSTARIVVPSSATANTDSLLVENIGTGGISLRSNNYEILLDSAGNISIPGDIIPDTDNMFDLGSTSSQWRSLYVSTNTIYIGNIPLTITTSGVLLVAGSPVSGAANQNLNTSDNVNFASVGATTVNVSQINGTNPGNELVIQTGGAFNFDFRGNGTLEAPGHIIPKTNLAFDLGSTSSQWRSLYVGTGTIYIGGVPITINTETNTLVVGSSTPSTSTNLATESYVIDYLAANGGGGAGLSSITIPASTGTTYKGLQVSYGLIHSNSQVNELNLSKIVIHKPAITSIEIDPTSEQDDFKVSGLGSSDVLAMFVLYGNTNGPKALSTLTTFAEVIIDNVILDGGEEGSFNTVDEMKSAFYSNFSTISAAAGGLDSDFEFYNPSTTVNTGTTTVQEGSGAAFSIVSPGDGFAYVDPPTVWLGSEGTNYLVGHKIKILGTDLGGITPDNDAIITITGVGAGGSITTATITGTGGDVGGGTYNTVTGTNYQVGSGFEVSQIFFTNTGTYDYLNLHSAGTNYVVGDILTLLGSGIVNGSSPTNDITITITAVDGGGVATTWTVSGVLPRQWRTNNISDGGNDQYDGANYINSSFASQINYNQGNTVADGIAAFGTGSSYTFVYNTGTFGLLVTGNASTYIETSGNSGADGDSTTESGNLYGPSTAAETFDNAVTHLNIVGDPYAGPIVSFTRPDNSDETIDILIPDDGEGAGVAIARDSNGNGIFNPYREGSWDSDVSPGGTLWNINGWADLSDVESRTYQPLYAAFGSGQLGNKIVSTECVMYLPDNGKYYAVKFSAWTQGGNGGGFAYTRRELDLAKLQEGIRFSDGTRLKSAEGVGRIKLQSPGNRRIEEVYGYKTVSLSQVVTTNLTTVASRSGSSTNTIWIDSTATTVDDIISNPANYNNAYDFEFSLDNNTWYEWTQSTSFSGNERGYSIATTVTYLQDDTIYFRYKTGGEPVVWWDKADLPGGSSNFRGAVIDYHAFTGESTIIGTIHIVNDDGEEHISHQEVQSGSTDGENDDLWLVTQEGQIKYRRIDGEGKTLKVQWSAKVFYGSELYD